MKTSSIHPIGGSPCIGLPERIVCDNGREFHSLPLGQLLTAFQADSAAAPKQLSPITGLLDGEIARRA